MDSNIDIEQLKRLNAAATQGEWKATLPRSGRWQISNGRVQVAAVWSTTDNPGKDVAEYIAAMHNAFPAIIARLEVAEAAMQSLHNLRTTHVRTADGKLACVEVSRPETHPGTFCMWKFKDFDLDSELADAEPGESITLTYRELTEDEFKDLGDFDGW